MKKIIKMLLSSALLLASASAVEQIDAIKVPGHVSQIGPGSRAWISSEYRDIMLYPHTTIESIDSEESMPKLRAKKARVKALHDGENIAFLFEWEDSTKNIKEGCCSKTNTDGFALQFPAEYSDVGQLPYIRMGSKGRKVVVHLKEAIEKTSKSNSDVYFRTLQEYYDTFYAATQEEDVDFGRVFIMEGIDFISEAKDDTALVVMDILYQDGVWKGTLSMPLKTEYLNLKKGAFPMSFVAWDGSAQTHDGVEYFSPWIGVKLLGERDGDTLIDALKNQANGDIYDGEKLAIEYCAACHNFSDSIKAPQNMAPKLSNVGGYSSVQYLRESIINPNAVVVRNYKSNVKVDFPWYSLDKNSNLVSTMPSYDWMDEKSINDLVAFFSSLKVESEK